MKEYTPSKVSRRNVLKTGITAIGVTGIPLVGASTDDSTPEKLYQRALQLREETGNNEIFRRILQYQGAEIATMDLNFSSLWREPEQQDSDVSTQKLHEADCSLEMTVTKYMDGKGSNGFGSYSYPHVDLYWEHSVDYSMPANETGELPDDIIGLTFENTDYDIKDGSWYHGDGTSKRERHANGVVFEYEDWNITEAKEGNDGDIPSLGDTYTLSDYAGMQVIPDQTSDPSMRRVFANYVHTYKETEIKNVSVSSAGEVTVTVGNQNKKWLKENIISEDEVQYQPC